MRCICRLGQPFSICHGGQAADLTLLKDLTETWFVSVRPARERIARFDRAVIESPAEPPHAIGRRSVRERFGNGLTPRHPLQPIVADRSGGIQAFFGVAGLEQPTLRGVMSPDAGVAIRLELETY